MLHSRQPRMPIHSFLSSLQAPRVPIQALNLLLCQASWSMTFRLSCLLGSGSVDLGLCIMCNPPHPHPQPSPAAVALQEDALL